MAVNSLVIGRVTKIKEDQVLLQILQVQEHKVQGMLEGVIRKNNIIEKESDSLKIEECFLPEDIVRAKVISLGSDKRVLLSTHESNCGVIFAREKDSRRIMVGYSWD